MGKGGGGKGVTLLFIQPLSPLELEQISAEFCSLCGSSDGTMGKATFTTLMNQLGYPERQCDDCYRYGGLQLERWCTCVLSHRSIVQAYTHIHAHSTNTRTYTHM